MAAKRKSDETAERHGQRLARALNEELLVTYPMNTDWLSALDAAVAWLRAQAETLRMNLDDLAGR